MESKYIAIIKYKSIKIYLDRLFHKQSSKVQS